MTSLKSEKNEYKSLKESKIILNVNIYNKLT